MPLRRVLLVDDNETFRETVKAALHHAGYGVCAVADAEAALDAVSRIEPSIALVDVELPGGMSGSELVQELTRRGAKFPIIAVSGVANEGSSGAAKWFVRKPVDLDLLLRVLDDFCGRGMPSSLWMRGEGAPSLDLGESFSSFAR
jgi:DNA-binding response OmpR family regulator